MNDSIDFKVAQHLERFHAELNVIKSNLENFKSKARVTPAELDSIASQVSAFSTAFAVDQTASFLPAHDRQSCNQDIQLLQAGVEALRGPAKAQGGRFGLKKKAPAASAPPPSVVPATNVSHSPSPAPSTAVESSVSSPPPSSTAAAPEEGETTPVLRPAGSAPWSKVTKHGRQLGNIEHGAISASNFFKASELASGTVNKIRAEITLMSLRNCIINLLPDADPSGRQIEVTALYVNDLRNCTIIAGYIPGSVRLENMTFGSLTVGCHQLRLENCSNVAVFSAVKNALAIEKSMAIGIGDHPRNLTYPLDSTSKHYEVQDFSSVTPHSSTNWSRIGDGTPFVTHLLKLFKMSPRHWPQGDGIEVLGSIADIQPAAFIQYPLK
ncbi:hypothetical protein FRB90_009883 [Tulasnella sp. 427]|nr:hypothetical protein FRB90_009883 [Tulasnella sp. 427]